MDSDRTPRRKDVKTLKQQLPYPYNQDLSKILRGLNRRTSFARRRLANDPVTAAYLAAAVRLIQRHLGPGASRTSADPDDDDSIERPLLSFLSQRAVAAEVGRNPPPFHRVGGRFFAHRAYIRSLQPLRSMVADAHDHESSAGGHCGSCAQ